MLLFSIDYATAFMRSGFSREVRFRGISVTILTLKRLKLTPEDAWAGKGFPPVFKGPSEDSGKLGVASGLVYVAWPLQKKTGLFVS